MMSDEMKRLIPIILLPALLLPSTISRGQAAGGGVVAYDPEISTVQGGALLDAQAVVSYDRKYVTINFQGQDSRPIALYEFPVIFNPTAGFVGGAIPNGEPPPGGAVVLSSPADIHRQGVALRSVLSQQGTFLLASIRNSR